MASLGRKGRLVAALAFAVVLAGCGYGVTGDASDVGDVSATVSGVADRSEPGDISWWFEYGTTTAYGSTTPRESTHITEPAPVSAHITGLTPSTTYHYRLCVTHLGDGAGICGVDRTFTTGAPRDHVEGSLWLYSPSEPPYNTLGIDVNVSSEPDGSNPTGTARGWIDDVDVVSGPVVCVRIVENRAAVGVESMTTGERVVIYIWDNGPGGDWFDGVAWSDPSTSCPTPPAEPGPDAYTDVSGDVTIIDAD